MAIVIVFRGGGFFSVFTLAFSTGWFGGWRGGAAAGWRSVNGWWFLGEEDASLGADVCRCRRLVAGTSCGAGLKYTIGLSWRAGVCWETAANKPSTTGHNRLTSWCGSFRCYKMINQQARKPQRCNTNISPTQAHSYPVWRRSSSWRCGSQGLLNSDEARPPEESARLGGIQEKRERKGERERAREKEINKEVVNNIMEIFRAS